MKTTDNLKLSTNLLWKHLKDKHPWAADLPIPLTVRLFRTSHLLKNWVDERIKVSTPQMRILFEALEPEGVSQSAIGKQYNIDPAAVTRTVQIMEKAGLVTRKVDPADNRLMRVYISEKGRELVKEVPSRLGALENELLKNWTNEEILKLHELLEKLENSLA